jgi:hypothetical protein
MTRVVAYVDGFNLYHGLKAGYGRGTTDSTFKPWSETCFGLARSCSRFSTSPRGSVTTWTPSRGRRSTSRR